MAEFRHDPVHRRWVIVTVDRARGPEDYEVSSRVPDEGFCPFCERQEGRTPPETYAVRETGNPDSPGWRIRVMPNKYPVLSGEDPDISRAAMGVYDWINGVGAHEIVVEHPQHHVLFHQFGVDHITELLRTWRLRLSGLLEDERFRYVMVFKNHGAPAGASVNHQHSQLLAMPVIPRIVAMALATAREHFHQKERCLFCDLLEQELDDGSRVVARNDHFVCCIPYASRFPFELAILPIRHSHDFASVGDDLLRPAAEILDQAMRRLAALFGELPFSLTIHTAPNATQGPRRSGYWTTLQHDWHWHIELIPRLGTTHGFEWGTGLYINPTPPEKAAEYLRQADI